jgi:hypothetical protein
MLFVAAFVIALSDTQNYGTNKTHKIFRDLKSLLKRALKMQKSSSNQSSKKILSARRLS